jgi:polyisoprenoid-binding protein YceI
MTTETSTTETSSSPRTTTQTSSGVRSGDWSVDPARSRVRFHTRAWFGLSPVLGRFARFAGELHVDGSGRATGELRIEAGSIDTGIKKRDSHLRSQEYFHAKAHPELTFTLTDLESAGDAYEVTGTLRIREKTLPIRTRAAITSTDSEMQIEARFPVDHQAAGLGWAKPGLIRKVVDADVNLVLVRNPAQH